MGQKGQATLEYVLVLSFLLFFLIGLYKVFSRGIDQSVMSIGTAFEQDLYTGKVRPNVWTN